MQNCGTCFLKSQFSVLCSEHMRPNVEIRTRARGALQIDAWVAKFGGDEAEKEARKGFPNQNISKSWKEAAVLSLSSAARSARSKGNWPQLDAQNAKNDNTHCTRETDISVLRSMLTSIHYEGQPTYLRSGLVIRCFSSSALAHTFSYTEKQTWSNFRWHPRHSHPEYPGRYL